MLFQDLIHINSQQQVLQVKLQITKEIIVQLKPKVHRELNIVLVIKPATVQLIVQIIKLKLIKLPQHVKLQQHQQIGQIQQLQ